MSLTKQVDLILDQHGKYENLVTIIEANAYQVGLLDACKRRADERGLVYNLQPHYTSRVNKPDPELGVQSMSALFENGLVHIPWGDAHSMRKMSIFVDELVQYPSGRTTDTVMAFWFAYRTAQQGMNTMKTVNRLHDGRNKEFWRGATWRRVLKNPYYDREQTPA